MSKCECGAAEPRDVIDLYTPLFQACGGRLYRLHITTDASAVLLSDGVSVETRLGSLERSLLANASTYFADTIAKRDALAPLTPGDRCYVFDATADTSVLYGGAMYIWLPALKWKKLYNGDAPIDGLNMIAQGGGLAVDGDGKLYVDANALPAGQLARLAALLRGNGLAVGSDGRIYVDLAAITASGMGLEVSGGKLAVKAQDLAGSGLEVSGRRLNVDTAALISPGGGLAAAGDGKLVLDLSGMSSQDRDNLSSSLIQAGGGLGIDANGHLFVDFSTMPTDKFEKILKALRLPIWLAGNTNFYVDKSHASASDSLDEGRGLSADKPFLTIQAAVNYVCDNFNLGNHNVYIHIAPGIYDESVGLGDYTTISGAIHLVGEDTGAEGLTTVIRRTNAQCVGVKKNVYHLKNLKFQETVNNSVGGFTNFLCVSENATAHLDRFELELDFGGVSSNRNLRPIFAIGTLNLANTGSGASKITVSNYTQGMEELIRVSGRLTMQNATAEFPSIICSGACSTFIVVAGGSFERNIGYSTVLGFSGEMTGKRYSIGGGGKCNVNGLGPDYFPGSTDGSVDSASFSWYK